MKDSSGGAKRRAPANQPPARGKQPQAHKAAPKRKRGFDKRWLVFLPALGLIYLAFVYANMAVNLPSPPEVLQGAQGMQIYDRNGELIQAFGDGTASGRVVPLSE